MTTPCFRQIATLSLVFCVFPLTGCLKRKETITVRPDLSVRIELEISGTKEELAGPDAMPSEATGWRVKRSVRTEGDEEKHVLEATAEFAARADLPGAFANPPGPFLEFPTEIRVEKRDEAEFLHFRRVYRPRAFAQTEYWNNRFVDDDVKKIADTPAESMTLAERVRLFKAFAMVEAHKRIEIAAAALESTVPTVKQDAWLLARRAMFDVFDRFDVEALAIELDGLDESARDKKVAALGETVPADAERAFVDTFAEAAKLDSNAVDRLRSALETENLRLRVTQSTRTHGFQIALHLPGDVIAHNGDRVEDGAIVWEFDGKAFADRDFELMATCQLAPK